VIGEPSALRSRPLIALLTAEAVSSLGSQMTFLAAAVVRAAEAAWSKARRA
jgi:hypothetical protein